MIATARVHFSGWGGSSILGQPPKGAAYVCAGSAGCWREGRVPSMLSGLSSGGCRCNGFAAPLSMAHLLGAGADVPGLIFKDSMAPITITMLGSGTSAGVPMIGCRCAVCTSDDPRDQRMRPSIAVSYGGENYLIDTTPELRLQAVRAGLERIAAVVYTHGHADHIFGLDDVRRYNTVMGSPLPLYAAAETMGTLRRAFPYAFEPPLDPSRKYKDAIYRPELEPHEIGGPFELGGRTWTPIDLLHGKARVLGFRIGNFAYCTDCSEIPPASREKLRGLDVLIIDALRARPHPTHLTFEQAAAVAAELRPGRTFFTHVAHDVGHADIEAALPGDVRVGYDGLKIEST